MRKSVPNSVKIRGKNDAAQLTAAQPPSNRITAKVMPSNRGAAAYNAAY